MKAIFLSILAALTVSVSAGAILWDGRFNDLTSSTDLNNWSWANQVGPYQYYIHGPSNVTAYVNLGTDFKNPADTGSRQGAKITLDSTSFWNGQNMRRTELIPQTKAAITTGKVFYHFSLKRSDVNSPSTAREHQIAFFESHFTELKSGGSDALLRWYVGGTSKWSTTWAAGEWHNIAYEIDFSANTVGFWHSTGSNALTRVVSPVSASVSSNGADWHVGVLELPNGDVDATEDLFWSGVYIENGEITTSVAGPGAPSGGGSTTSSQVSSATSSSTLITTQKATTSTSTASPTTTSTCSPVQMYGQCGGKDFTGCTICVSSSTCKVLNDYYSQCL